MIYQTLHYKDDKGTPSKIVHSESVVAGAFWSVCVYPRRSGACNQRRKDEDISYGYDTDDVIK